MSDHTDSVCLYAAAPVGVSDAEAAASVTAYLHAAAPDKISYAEVASVIVNTVSTAASTPVAKVNKQEITMSLFMQNIQGYIPKETTEDDLLNWDDIETNASKANLNVKVLFECLIHN